MPTPSALSKTPGVVHCYQLTCHRVLTIEETKSLVSSTRILVASYYDDPRVDPSNTGELTSSGEKFDADNSGRVASAIYPDGTELLLWNPLNGRTAHVRVNDFGPFHSNRTLDLTRALAKRLDVTHQGVTVLLATVVAPPLPEEPLYRSFRKYPKAKGYLGVYDEDALPAIAKKLTDESNGLSAVEPTDPRIASNIPVPVRKPSPRFGPRDTIRTANHPSETIFDQPPPTLRSLPPLDTGFLLTPPLADKTNVQPDVVVASNANTPSRAAEVSIKRLTFSGVWSEALPRRSTPRPTILPHRRIHGHDRPSATRSGEHRLDECEGGPSTKRSAAPSRRDTNASARNDVSRQTVRAGIRDRPRPSNQWMLGLNEGYSHRRQCRRRLRLPPARHQIQWQVDWRCRCRGGYSQRVCERQDSSKDRWIDEPGGRSGRCQLLRSHR